jgi:2-polyprenyl-6-methoxyphenol hydroxylase-like FAD-dependent oxidoreductase
MARSRVMRRHRVVIAGYGFAGLFAARTLRRAEVDVTVIDRSTSAPERSLVALRATHSHATRCERSKAAFECDSNRRQFAAAPLCSAPQTSALANMRSDDRFVNANI